MRPMPVLFLLTLALPARAGDVACPAAAPHTRTQHYVEEWSTDPDSDEYLMGNIQSVATSDNGDVYLLDVQQQEVHAFNADGSYRGIVARKGEGPGEISQVWSVATWGNDTVVLPQSFPARIVRVSREGDPLPEMRIMRHPEDESPAGIHALLACGDQAIVSGNIFSWSSGGNKNERWVGVIGRDGTLLHEFGVKAMDIAANPMQQDYDEMAMFWGWDRWGVSTDGRVYMAPERDQYRIDEYTLAGERVRSISRPITPRKRSDAELDEIRDSRGFFFNGQKAEIKYILSDVNPPITNLTVIGDRLWVRLDDGDGAAYGRFAVHSLDGELLEEVTIELDYDAKLDMVHMLPDGRIVVVENGISAQQAHFAAFGMEAEENEADVEPLRVVVYEMKP